MMTLRNPRKVWPRKMDRLQSAHDLVTAIGERPLLLVVYQYTTCSLCCEVAEVVNAELSRRADLSAVWADPAAIACDTAPDVLPAAHVFVQGEKVAELIGLQSIREDLGGVMEHVCVPKPTGPGSNLLQMFMQGQRDEL